MVYRFQSKAAGDVLMLQEAGDQVLLAMGKQPQAQGVILAQDMPRAIRAIEAAVVLDEARPRATQPAAPEGQQDADVSEPVSLRQRAWPLVELMRRAQADGEPVIWDA